MICTPVGPYLAIFAARFLMMVQYREAAVAGIVTQFWFGAIMVMALSAFYMGGRGSASMTRAEAITYIWLGQAFLGLLQWNVDPEIVLLMRTGNIAYERLRPINTYFYWLVRAMAWLPASVEPAPEHRVLRSRICRSCPGKTKAALVAGSWTLQSAEWAR